MTGFDLHPEELLDRVRRGQATPAERDRVEQHLHSCEACRFEHALLAQGARDAAPHPGDAARARRIEQGALAVLAARGMLAPQVVSATSSSAKRRRRAGALIAAAVVSSLATAAAAAVIQQPTWLVNMLPVQLTDIAASPKAPPRPHKAHAPHPLATAPAPAPAPDSDSVSDPDSDSVSDPDSDSVSDSDSDSDSVSDSASDSASGSASAAHPPHRPAADLFAAANLARREHQTATAVRLYRDLLRAHPRSDEASVSRVALGRLLLDRVGDARAALREFDAYLAVAGQGALREDALIGRALSLGRLGRAREEHAAWKALLAAYPSSGYAERARARLLELRCSVEPC